MRVNDIAGWVLRDHGIDLDFTVLEVGARPIGSEREPFYILPDIFPASRILGFEPDLAHCEKLNGSAPAFARQTRG
jgi:hypothetical protein